MRFRRAARPSSGMWSARRRRRRRDRPKESEGTSEYDAECTRGDTLLLLAIRRPTCLAPRADGGRGRDHAAEIGEPVVVKVAPGHTFDETHMVETDLPGDFPEGSIAPVLEEEAGTSVRRVLPIGLDRQEKIKIAVEVPFRS